MKQKIWNLHCKSSCSTGIVTRFSLHYKLQVDQKRQGEIRGKKNNMPLSDRDDPRNDALKILQGSRLFVVPDSCPSYEMHGQKKNLWTRCDKSYRSFLKISLRIPVRRYCQPEPAKRKSCQATTESFPSSTRSADFCACTDHSVFTRERAQTSARSLLTSRHPNPYITSKTASQTLTSSMIQRASTSAERHSTGIWREIPIPSFPAKPTNPAPRPLLHIRAVHTCPCPSQESLTSSAAPQDAQKHGRESKQEARICPS